MVGFEKIGFFMSTRLFSGATGKSLSSLLASSGWVIFVEVWLFALTKMTKKFKLNFYLN